jgi:uncharacterized protein (TIGR02391 family)
MTTSFIASFPLATIENVCQAISDLYTGSELTSIIVDCGLKSHDPGPGWTKWRRLAHVVDEYQKQKQRGDGLISLVKASMRPQRIMKKVDAANITRGEINQSLAFEGYSVSNDGKVHHTSKATTAEEAINRNQRLIDELKERNCHSRILQQCKPEYLSSDYYEVVFESIKDLGTRLSDMCGLDLDGSKVVDAALGGKLPSVQLNPFKTETQKNEQRGIANLAKGLFSAFRNPIAHETRNDWNIEEQDALDILATLSLIHRRLDKATTVSSI